MSSHRTLEYRADIDGLRAVAIVPVILFHAGFAFFGGGFIGVDVFFVISGYLITSLLVKDLQSGSFSLLDFWERRARRILPASIVMIAACLLAGWFLLGPGPYRSLGESAAAQQVFLSNLLFWQAAGYFDAPSEAKPLLHTWSLSVEEQYYLLVPFVLSGLSRYRPHSLAKWLLLIWVASFITSLIWLEIDEEGAFYLLPSRMWELMTGSLLAVWVLRGGEMSGRLREISGWGGLALIVGGVLLIDSNTPFPGVAALAPCLGTAAVIWAGSAGPVIVSRFLGNRIFVAIGLISYSLYLWHWPIIVFHKVVSRDEGGIPESLLIIVSSFVAAWLSYRFVETPFRRRRLLARRAALFRTAAFAMVPVILSGCAIALTDGATIRFHREIVERWTEAKQTPENCRRLSGDRHRSSRFCTMGPPSESPRIIVWGDSHARAMKPAFEQLAVKYSVPVWIATSAGCAPLPGVFRAAYSSTKRRICDTRRTATYEAIRAEMPSDVVLIGRWAVNVMGFEERYDTKSKLISDRLLTSRSPEDARIVFRRNFMRLLSDLHGAGIRVWVMKQVPLQASDVPDRLFEFAWRGGNRQDIAGRPIAEHKARQRLVEPVIDEAVQRGLVAVLDPAELLCDENGYCRIVDEGRSLYRDDDHLSVFGAVKLAPLFEPVFRTASAEPVN